MCLEFIIIDRTCIAFTMTYDSSQIPAVMVDSWAGLNTDTQYKIQTEVIIVITNTGIGRFKAIAKHNSDESTRVTFQTNVSKLPTEVYLCQYIYLQLDIQTVINPAKMTFKQRK